MASSAAPDGPIRRLLVVGGPGAGKSTFARRLGEKLALPVIHLVRVRRFGHDREAAAFLAMAGAA
jgi:dephospho-CoA kinase